MEESVEGFVAVLGHPIAGNPSQFALERAFQHLRCSWRVLSFEIAPEVLTTALDGLAVLGCRGILLDETLARPAAIWSGATSTKTVDQDEANELPTAAESVAPPDRASSKNDAREAADVLLLDELSEMMRDRVDCFAHDPTSPSGFIASYQRGDGLLQCVRRYLESTSKPVRTPLWLGRGASRVDFPPTLSRVTSADVIVVSDMSHAHDSSRPSNSGSPRLDADRWPAGDRLVIDLTRDGHDQLPSLRSRGYHVIDYSTQRVMAVRGAIKHWTDRDFDADLINDAFEEFMAI